MILVEMFEHWTSQSNTKTAMEFAPHKSEPQELIITYAPNAVHL